MIKSQRIISIALLMTLILAPVFAQSQPTRQSSPVVNKKAKGNGTTGRISMWTGSSTLGDSSISEDKQGRVGIGVTNPTSPLSVNGIIETRGAQGGIRFPDGTVQTTAATPFGPSIPILLTGSAPGGIIEAVNDNGVGLFGQSTGRDGVFGRSLTGPGVRGLSGSIGVLGIGSGEVGRGVYGKATGGRQSYGVFGESDNGVGVFGSSSNDDGVFGASFSNRPEDTGIRGIGGGNASAGDFSGRVNVSGMLTKGGGSFRIDHPLDPENKYLSHSFVESPDMMNIYNGNVTTDHNGLAVVELPDYFEALNSDFRYQLTVIGQFAQAIVAEKVKGNRFTIQTSDPWVEVSWQVTGIRRDAWANKNRIQVEEKKSDIERGHFLHPEAFEQPEERGVEWAHRPELMRQLKQQRIEAGRTRQKRQ